MINRKKTKLVNVGIVKVGGGNPVIIQSMTNVATTDVDKCVSQIKKLRKAGCELVRVAVPTRADTEAFAKIVSRVAVPLIADIHFSPERAIEAIEGGAAKVRLNPGNIKNRADIHRIIDSAKMHKAAIRVGVNEASIRDLSKGDITEERRVKLMLKEMKTYVSLFEKRGFESIVLSAKSSDVVRTIEINRLLSETFDYPIHLGLTHAGLPQDAAVPSAIALGTLLSEGIGDTLRVSFAGDPVLEPEFAKKVLTSLGMYPRAEVELVVCPTCARAQIDVIGLAKKVKKALGGIHRHIRVAVMGCIVNGPGEAADADVAICAGKGKGYIYKNGKKVAVVPEEKLIDVLLEQLRSYE